MHALRTAIQNSLQDIHLRLDALQGGLNKPNRGKPDVPPAGIDIEARIALAAAHATLSGLVEQMGRSLNAPQGPDGARPSSILTERPIMRTPLRYDHSDADSDEADLEDERRSFRGPLRQMVFAVSVAVLAVIGARVSMQIFDTPPTELASTQPVQHAEIQPSRPEVPRAEAEALELMRSQAPNRMLTSEEAAAPGAREQDNHDNNVAIGRPATISASQRESREPTLPLPESLPATLRLEARRGKPAAEYEVGVRLVEGTSVPVNVEEGLRWLRRAANSGVIPAHLWIGSLYEKGIGVEKDLNLARTHYLAAAEKGNAKAMHNLAVLYAEGIDGRRDYRTAVRWFQRAAERGIADSQYNLGTLLTRGIGIDQNHQEAYKWFALAAAQGDREAARHRDDIGRRLDPGALAAARNAVQTFSPQPQPSDAITVAAPPGGWDRPGDDKRKSRSGIFARGAS